MKQMTLIVEGQTNREIMEHLRDVMKRFERDLEWCDEDKDLQFNNAMGQYYSVRATN